MSYKNLFTSLLDGSAYRVSTFADKFDVEQEIIEEKVSNLEEQGIVKTFPGGLFITSEVSDQDEREKHVKLIYREFSDLRNNLKTEVTVGGSLYEKDVSFETDKNPSELI